MRPQIVKILILVLFLVNSITMLGQSLSGSSGPPPPYNRAPPDAPIDESIVILIIAGLIYGVFIAYKNKRINTPE